MIGRRSLVYHISNEHLMLSSVCDQRHFKEGWRELPAHGIYCININFVDVKECLKKIILYPWVQGNAFTHPSVVDLESNITVLSNNSSVLDSHPIFNDLPSVPGDYGMVPLFGEFNRALPGCEEEPFLIQDICADNIDLSTLATNQHHADADCLLKLLRQSVCKRVGNQPPVGYFTDTVLSDNFTSEPVCLSGAARVAVLYSGGIDSHLLAALADE